jgi:hypothetical protein
MVFVAVLVSVASSAYLFRGYLSGIYIGEMFDTRLMIILHEHWFRFFAGKTSFLDAEFFYPYPRSFALTDTFLLTGITHSILRVFGLEIIDAWALSQFIWVLIGLLGWFFLARKIIKNKFLQLLTIPLIATSFPFVAHLNERPNVVPYLLASWVFLFLFNFYFADSKKQRSLNLGLSIVALPLIVLTSWYAGFFIVIFLFLLILMSVIARAIYLREIFDKLKNLDAKIFTPFALISVVLTSFWAFIYLPELSNSAEVARPTSEVIDGSPALLDILNTSALGGSKILSFFNTPYVIMQEELIGLSIPLVLTVIALAVITFIFIPNLISNKTKQFLMLLLTSGLIIEFLIIKFFNNNSIFIILFEQISFLKSIRTPVRWHIYFTFLLILILLYFIDMFLKTTNKRMSLLIILIPLLVLVEQQRTPPGLWTADEFIDENLLSYKGKTKNCEAFFLDRPDIGYWLDISHAMALTLFINTPTVNGYSGSRPQDYPGMSWYSDGDLPAIGKWLTLNGSLENVCMLDGINFKPLLNFGGDKIDFSVGRGFTGLEKSKSNYWAWSVWEKSTVYLQSFKNTTEDVEVSFTLEIPDCLNEASFKITVPDVVDDTYFSDGSPLEIKFPLTISAWERMSMEIEKDPGFCNVEGDPRDLHFSVKNLQIKEIK